MWLDGGVCDLQPRLQRSIRLSLRALREDSSESHIACTYRSADAHEIVSSCHVARKHRTQDAHNIRRCQLRLSFMNIDSLDWTSFCLPLCLSVCLTLALWLAASLSQNDHHGAEW